MVRPDRRRTVAVAIGWRLSAVTAAMAAAVASLETSGRPLAWVCVVYAAAVALVDWIALDGLHGGG